MTNSSRTLTTLQAAERLGVSRRFVQRLAAERQIPYIKLGNRCFRFAEDDLDAYIKNHRVEKAAM